MCAISIQHSRKCMYLKTFKPSNTEVLIMCQNEMEVIDISDLIITHENTLKADFSHTF